METSDDLQISKEDILRTLAEHPQDRGIPVAVLELELGIHGSSLRTAIAQLETDRLVRVQQDVIRLTESGRASAMDTLSKHLTAERYLAQTRSAEQAHASAHVLEHFMSAEVLANLKAMANLSPKGVPLTDFPIGVPGIITNIDFPDFTLFERVVSMGIAPGEPVSIFAKNGRTIIAKIGRLFALGESISRGIEVLGYEEP